MIAVFTNSSVARLDEPVAKSLINSVPMMVLPPSNWTIKYKIIEIAYWSWRPDTHSKLTLQEPIGEKTQYKAHISIEQVKHV